MPYRKHSKSKHRAHMSIDKFLAMPQPPGEDFFAFSFIFDDPDHPTWDTRQTSFGSWDMVTNTIRKLLDLFEFQNGRFEWYQGANARNYLSRGVIEEKRFHQERSSQPNN